MPQTGVPVCRLPVRMEREEVPDNFSPHTSTKADQRVTISAEASNLELAYTPTYSSWLNRSDAQFQALRYFALDGTDHPSHKEKASMIRPDIICRDHDAHDRVLRELVKRANAAYRGTSLSNRWRIRILQFAPRPSMPWLDL